METITLYCMPEVPSCSSKDKTEVIISFNRLEIVAQTILESFLLKLFDTIVDSMTMEQIILSLDISPKTLKAEESAELQREISHEIDKALRAAEIGKWVDGYCALDIMTLAIQTEEPETAIPIIKSTLAEYQLFPQMEIYDES